MTRHATQNCATEWSYSSGRSYDDPFNDVVLDVEFTDPDGEALRVPAFWAGGQTWTVRYASPKPGTHRYRTVCSDADNADLHGLEGTLEVAPYEGDNPLLRQGPLRVSADRRRLEHADGRPFFWLGDTWWMGLCARLGWPGEFQQLAADRLAKGFTVIQIVAGLYPDMPQFDPRGANEAGFPWEPDYARINPAYFDMADVRLAHLVRSGLMPCIVGCWGYFLPWTGVDRMKQHWRNLVARYGAYPVVWCLAGEGVMPYYLSEDKEADAAFMKSGWTELGRYLHDIDPYAHPVTIHPGDTARNTVDDPSVLDFDMLQTGHGDRGAMSNTVRLVNEGRTRPPTMPVINGEVCYEGIGEASRQEVQRFMFWACMLSGAAGHTYGANGIWQVNRRDEPFGPSPHGMSWGHVPWDQASQLPGSGQLGLAAGLLQRYDWWRFEPHQDWIEPAADQDNPQRAFAAGVPGQVRVAYLTNAAWGTTWQAIEPDVAYRAFLWSPVDGGQIDLGEVSPDKNGAWRPDCPQPIYQDWVMVLEAT